MQEDVFSHLSEGIKTVLNSPNEREKKLSKSDLFAVCELYYLQTSAIQRVYISTCFSRWPRGPMDKASDYVSGDSRFESWRGRSFLDEKSFKKVPYSLSTEEPSLFVQKQPKQIKLLALRLYRKK